MRTLALCLILMGCGPSYRVTTERDEFNGLTIHEMKGNEIVEYGTPRTWQLNARLTLPDTAYSLLVRYSGSVWFFLNEEPVRFRVDGREVEGIESGRVIDRSVGQFGLVYELVAYPVSPEVFRAIGLGQSVTVRFNSDTRYYDLDLRKDNIQRFRDFAKQYCR